MALASSSLALAADSLAQKLQAALTDIFVIVDTPAAAQKLAESTANKHFLNIFIYRVAASPVHAAQTPGQPLFLRLFALLTPFPRIAAQAGETYPALRILGEAIRFFHEQPVTDVLATPQGANGTAYRLQVIPQAPNMEELNHIWTTQGSELSYQLSAAYEFALLPIDPLVPEAPSSEVRTTVLQVDAHLGRRDERPVSHDMEHRAFPALAEGEAWTGPVYLPQMLALGPDGPVETLTLPQAPATLDLAVAGIVSQKAELRLSHRDAAGAEIRQAAHVVTIASQWLDLAAAKVSLAVPDTAGTVTLIAEIRAADAAGQPLVPDRVGATLTLAVEPP